MGASRYEAAAVIERSGFSTTGRARYYYVYRCYGRKKLGVEPHSVRGLSLLLHHALPEIQRLRGRDRGAYGRAPVGPPAEVARSGVLHAVVEVRRGFLEAARLLGLFDGLGALGHSYELVRHIGAARDIAFLPGRVP